MTLAFTRRYSIAPVGQALATDSSAASTAAAKAPAADTASPSPLDPSSQNSKSFYNDDDVTTRACHTWSYHDQATDETTLVTLFAHHSLHVRVAPEQSDNGAADDDSSPLSAHPASAVDCDVSAEGLCGYTWELTWLPCPTAAPPSAPSPSISSPSHPSSASVPEGVRRARFFFPRTAPLPQSTAQGSGGVVFLSCRHVLIATEGSEASSATAAASSAPATGKATTSSSGNSHRAPHCLYLDSFVVEPRRSVEPTLVDPALSHHTPSQPDAGSHHQWTRRAHAAALPCTFPPLKSSALGVHTLLVRGEHITSSAAPQGFVRLLYAAVMLSHAGLPSNAPDETVFVGVADITAPANAPLNRADCAVGAAAQGLCVECLPRHAAVASHPPLRLALPPSQRAGEAAVVPLRSTELLWVYVADAARNREAGGAGTQLYGSLVAVLPCAAKQTAGGSGGAAAAAAAVAVADGGSALVRCRLPRVPCSGFTDSSPFGVVGVVSGDLDCLANEHAHRVALAQRSHSRSMGGAASSALAVEEALKQLLPTAERTVYGLEIGQPRERISSTGATTAAAASSSASASLRPVAADAGPLPLHTSVLLFVCDGVVPRASGGEPCGLYATESATWASLAEGSSTPSASASFAFPRRVPLARTLWHGLRPITASFSAKRSVSLSANVPTPPSLFGAHGSVASWALTDMPRWRAWLSMCGSARSASNSHRSNTVLRSGAVVGSAAAAAAVDVLEQRTVEEEEEGEGGEWVSGTQLLTSAAATSATTTTASSASALGGITAVLSSTPGCKPADSSTEHAHGWCGCLPRLDSLTQHMTVWYYISTADNSTGTAKSDKAAAAAAGGSDSSAALAATSLPPLTPEDYAHSPVDWEMRVAEWAAAQCLHSAPGSSAEATAAVTTYAVLKLLWVLSVVCTAGPAAGSKATAAAWPQALMDVLRSGAADAAQHHTALHVFAHAVQALVAAELASSPSASNTTAHQADEVGNMRCAATLFLRLTLRTLVEVDWRAGDAHGRCCAAWMVQWLLGRGGAMAVGGDDDTAQEKGGAASAGASSSTTTAAASAAKTMSLRDAIAEGRAMQVLMHLSVSEKVLAWLRRMLLLYSCRRHDRPLELTLEDIVEASGVLVDAPCDSTAQHTQTKGWSEEDEYGVEVTAAAERRDAAPAGQHAEELSDMREMMENALLRMVQPDCLHGLLHGLAFVSPAQLLSMDHGTHHHPQLHQQQAQHGVKAFVVHGLLSVADLYALVCTGWTAAHLQDSAPPGFSFVCLCVDVALRAVTAPAAAAAAAEHYESMVCAALAEWDGRGRHSSCSSDEEASHDAQQEGYVPVYPLTSLLDRHAKQPSFLAAGTSAPFPFSLLPPLLTVYTWYHVIDDVCGALQLAPPPPTTTTAAAAVEACDGSKQAPVELVDDEVQSQAWWRRGQAEAALLRALHRGVCVLRYLTQENAACAEEVFAAMQLVYQSPTPIDSSGADSNVWERQPHGLEGGTAAQCSSSRGTSWGHAYLIAWQHLLPLDAPPLSSQDAVALYVERCMAASDSFADVMRVLHLVYASVGSGHALRAQMWRATTGITNTNVHPSLLSQSNGMHGSSLKKLELSLRSWRTAAALPPNSHTVDTRRDALAMWLVHIWTHVLLCDPTAATDVGIYEHMYAALAHTRQRLDGLSSAQRGGDAAAAAAAADVAFAVLRPCVVYAYPLLMEMAVAEEVQMSAPVSSRTSPAPQAKPAPPHHGTVDAARHCRPPQPPTDASRERQRYLQLNEPLIWHSSLTLSAGDVSGCGGAQALSPPAAAQELEQLCAGEVCERVRRQLSRLSGLYEGGSSGGGSSSRGKEDRRFRVLALLLSLLPAVVDVAGRQRKLLQLLRQHEEESGMDRGGGASSRSPAEAAAAAPQRVMQHSAGEVDRDAAETSKPPSSNSATATRSASSCRSSGCSSRESSESDDTAVDVAYFYLSPLSAYAMAASAVALSQCDERNPSSSSSKSTIPPPLRQQQGNEEGPVTHVGWFTMGCELLRRELGTYLHHQLLLTGMIRPCAAAHSSSSSDGEGGWRLVATEKHVKALLNALADAVEPLTHALVSGLALPLFQPVVLLLVFESIHQLFSPAPDAGGKTEDGRAATASRAVHIHADPPMMQQIHRWVRQVVAPLFAQLSPPEKKTVRHVLATPEFVQACGAADSAEAVEKATGVAYTESHLHSTWRQWRHHHHSSSSQARGSSEAHKAEASMMPCLEACVAAAHRPLLRLAPAAQAAGSEPSAAAHGRVETAGSHQTQQSEAMPVVVSGKPTSSVGAAPAQGGASWREAGSALRSSLIHTIGATVAPRGGQAHASSTPSSPSSSSAATPQPAPTHNAAHSHPPTSYMPPTGTASQSAALHRTPSLASAAVTDAAAPGTRHDLDEAVALLVKEETFKRRQLTHQLLHSQQTDVFASPDFQRALINMYLAMRAEKRRRELRAFALEQHDIIFTFASRTQQLLLEHCRRSLREAWIEYGERQRLAMRRLLQAERDGRMGVEALAYARRAALRDAEAAERKVWVAQEEGRCGVEGMEEDARDALGVAAAQAAVEMARRAVEAEEEAYWKAEEAAWAEEEQQEREGGSATAGKLATKARVGGVGVRLSNSVKQPMGQREASDKPAAPAATTQANRQPAHVPWQHRSPLEAAAVVGEEEAPPLPAAPTSTLFGTLSRWQSALMETVAPPPPPPSRPAAREMATAALATERTGGEANSAKAEVTPPPLPPAAPRVSHPLRPTSEAMAHQGADSGSPQARKGKAGGDDDGWDWGSTSSDDEAETSTAAAPVVHAVPVVPLPPRRGSSTTAAPTVTAPPPTTQAARVVPLTSRAFVPLRSAAPPPPPLQHSLPHVSSAAESTQLSTSTAESPTHAASTAAAREGEAETASSGIVGKVPRRKKGLAAAVLVEPISSSPTAAAAATTVASRTTLAAGTVTLPDSRCAAPMNATQQQSPRSAVHEPLSAARVAVDGDAKISLDDATPNPARSILSAVEAAATETVSRTLRAAAVEAPLPAPSSRRSFVAAAAKEASPTRRDGQAVTPQQRTVRMEDGWSDDDDEDGIKSSGGSSDRGSRTTQALLVSLQAATMPSAELEAREEDAADAVPAVGGPVVGAVQQSSEERAVPAEQNAEDGWGWSDDDEGNSSDDGLAARREKEVDLVHPPLPHAAALAVPAPQHIHQAQEESLEPSPAAHADAHQDHLDLQGTEAVVSAAEKAPSEDGQRADGAPEDDRRDEEVVAPPAAAQATVEGESEHQHSSNDDDGWGWSDESSETNDDDAGDPLVPHPNLPPTQPSAEDSPPQDPDGEREGELESQHQAAAANSTHRVGVPPQSVGFIPATQLLPLANDDGVSATAHRSGWSDDDNNDNDDEKSDEEAGDGAFTGNVAVSGQSTAETSVVATMAAANAAATPVVPTVRLDSLCAEESAVREQLVTLL